MLNFLHPDLYLLPYFAGVTIDDSDLLYQFSKGNMENVIETVNKEREIKYYVSMKNSESFT